MREIAVLESYLRKIRRTNTIILGFCVNFYKFAIY